MPNGKPGDHPITDMLVHGEHPFPTEIEIMIRKVHEIDPTLLKHADRYVDDWIHHRNVSRGCEFLESLIKENR
jgi:hypothetical protein